MALRRPDLALARSGAPSGHKHGGRLFDPRVPLAGSLHPGPWTLRPLRGLSVCSARLRRVIQVFGDHPSSSRIARSTRFRSHARSTRGYGRSALFGGSRCARLAFDASSRERRAGSGESGDEGNSDELREGVGLRASRRATDRNSDELRKGVGLHAPRRATDRNSGEPPRSGTRPCSLLPIPCSLKAPGVLDLASTRLRGNGEQGVGSRETTGASSRLVASSRHGGRTRRAQARVDLHASRRAPSGEPPSLFPVSDSLFPDDMSQPLRLATSHGGADPLPFPTPYSLFPEDSRRARPIVDMSSDPLGPAEHQTR
jgi:hypothetical protein